MNEGDWPGRREENGGMGVWQTMFMARRGRAVAAQLQVIAAMSTLVRFYSFFKRSPCPHCRILIQIIIMFNS